MDKEMMSVLEDLKESVVKELRALNKKDSLSAQEVKTATDAMCLLLKIKMYEEGGMEYSEDDGSYAYYGTRFMMNGSYDHGMDGSYGRGRSPVTGRYISRDGRYSSHSINDRMIAKLEEMYDDAKTEHEREEVRREIERLRNQPM